MLFFMMFITLMNIYGMVKGIGVLQVVAFSLMFGGMFADMTIWTDLWILPMSIVIINAVILLVGILRGRR